MSIDHQSFLASEQRLAARGQRTRLHGRGVGDVEFGVIWMALAGLVGYGLITGHELIALGIGLGPVLIWLLVSPLVSLVLLAVMLPDLRSLTGAHGGLNISVSDLLLVLSGAGILLHAALSGSSSIVRALRPVLPWLLQYGTLVVVLLVFHPTAGVLAQTAQRYELFLLPVIAGVFAALKRREIWILRAYVVSTTVLALVWPVHGFGMQKNPVGQLIVNAVILVVSVRRLRRLLPCLIVLVPGLFLTGSRGAVVSLLVGIAVIGAIQGFRARSAPTRALLLVVLAGMSFTLLPTALQTRLTTFSAAAGSSGAYAVQLRQQYAKDAQQIIDQHPLIGVGVGNFASADAFSPVRIDDPHQVLLLQAVEGGYGFALSFVVLIAGCAAALWRMREIELAPAALAVLLATVAHGMVDVYWVRGTPVLGWLLVGMACGGCWLKRHRETAA